MKQTALVAGLTTKHMCKHGFLGETERAGPWAGLIKLISVKRLLIQGAGATPKPWSHCVLRLLPPPMDGSDQLFRPGDFGKHRPSRSPSNRQANLSGLFRELSETSECYFVRETLQIAYPCGFRRFVRGEHQELPM